MSFYGYWVQTRICDIGAAIFQMIGSEGLIGKFNPEMLFGENFEISDVF